MEWFALLIPAASLAYLHHKHKFSLASWEYLVVFLVAIVAILLGKTIGGNMAASDTEYWGGWAVSSTYTEPWQERVSCKHDYDCNCSTDSKGDESCDTCYSHSYDVEHHPPEWRVDDSNGASHPVSESVFLELSRRWKNKQFSDLNHSNVHDNNDGGAYTTNWDNRRETIATVTTEHSWTNKVVASNSIHKFRPVPPDDVKNLGLHQYPQVANLHAPCLLGNAGNQTAKTEEALQYHNATLGAVKKVRIWLLVFTDKPIAAGLTQEALWQRGNKNELVVCVGLDKAQHVQWAYVFSWTDRADLVVEARTKLTGLKGKPVDLPGYVEWLAAEVKSKWKKKDFKEFDYLAVTLTTGTTLLIYFITAVATAIASHFVASNSHYAGGEGAPRHNKRGST